METKRVFNTYKIKIFVTWLVALPIPFVMMYFDFVSFGLISIALLVGIWTFTWFLTQVTDDTVGPVLYTLIGLIVAGIYLSIVFDETSNTEKLVYQNLLFVDNKQIIVDLDTSIGLFRKLDESTYYKYKSMYLRDKNITAIEIYSNSWSDSKVTPSGYLKVEGL